jgi:hypothetical protein
MRELVAALCLLFIMGSCDKKMNYDKPENLISKQQMIDLLYDMHLAIGTSNLQNLKLEKNRNYMSLVYKKYGIDSTQFAESNIYYTANINEYEAIFEEVEKRLKIIQDSFQRRGDSVVTKNKAPNYPEILIDSLKN